MPFAVIYSRASCGITAPLVRVEVHISRGVPKFIIVGLPETAVKESKDRVRSAIQNSQFEFPIKRITINLSPADLRKEGSRFDLPIAIGILLASGQIHCQDLNTYEFSGELGLAGQISAVKGLLPFAIATARAKKQLIIPAENMQELAMIKGLSIYGADDLISVCAHLQNQKQLDKAVAVSYQQTDDSCDLSEVRGQSSARRALEVAAAGGHSLLMIGPPGVGKTLLASRLPSILPPMSDVQALEVAAIASISGQPISSKQWYQRPFRAPHHTASSVALVGGGSSPRPGEISLAHHGVLFLDELPEFERRVLETLREPMESGRVIISRAARQAEFPAQFQLIAALNPCPCGQLGNPSSNCRCSSDQVRRYLARLSGPLLDRIDMHIEVPPLAKGVLTAAPSTCNDGETSAKVRARVVRARQHALARSGCANYRLSGKVLQHYCALTPSDNELLERAMQQLGLSARAYHRILRVARTIADLCGSEKITTAHLTEAIHYRRLERLSQCVMSG